MYAHNFFRFRRGFRNTRQSFRFNFRTSYRPFTTGTTSPVQTKLGQKWKNIFFIAGSLGFGFGGFLTASTFLQKNRENNQVSSSSNSDPGASSTQQKNVLQRTIDAAKLLFSVFANYKEFWDVLTHPHLYIRLWHRTDHPPSHPDPEEFIDMKTFLLKLPKRHLNEYSKKWTLVLDGRIFTPINEDFTFPENPFMLPKRPHVDMFMMYASEFYEVVVLNLPIGQDLLDPMDMWVTYWANHGSMDLMNMGRDPERVLAVGLDDFSERLFNCENNLIVVNGWDIAKPDTILLDLLYYLKDMSFYDKLDESVQVAIETWNEGSLRKAYNVYRTYLLSNSQTWREAQMEFIPNLSIIEYWNEYEHMQTEKNAELVDSTGFPSRTIVKREPWDTEEEDEEEKDKELEELEKKVKQLIAQRPKKS